MSITSTTLTPAITGYQTEFALGSTSGVTAPSNASSTGLTYLYIGNEMMLVVAVPVSTQVRVVRGVLGTQAVAHVASSVVLIGAPSDFPSFTPELGSFQTKQLNRYVGVYAPVAAAATIVAPGSLFHVTGTTATNIITPPNNFVEGSLTIVADAGWSWVSSSVTNGIAQSGSVSGAGSAVTFVFDAATARWYPSQSGSLGNYIAMTTAVAAATTIAASGRLFHVTGTTATNIITPPSNFSEGAITIIADGAWTWTSSAVANGIAQSGAVTSAGDAVIFTYDATTTYWYPSRVA